MPMRGARRLAHSRGMTRMRRRLHEPHGQPDSRAVHRGRSPGRLPAYYGRMVRRARRIVVDPDLAEEAAQEAFVRAWRSRASFDPVGGPVLNWLLVITRNVAIDLVKARRRRPPVASTSAAGAGRGRPRRPDRDRSGAAPRPACPCPGRHRHHHRQAVVETILLDRPYQEVGADLGIPEGTIRSRVYYALRRLRSSSKPLTRSPALKVPGSRRGPLHPDASVSDR